MRVVIADPQAKVRSALRLLLEQHLRLPVSGEAGTAEELLRLTGAACPDLVLLDWDLPGIEPAGILQSVRRQCPTAKFIVLSGKAEVGPAALAAGAHKFVSKGVPPEALMAAVVACSAQCPGTQPTAAATESNRGSEIPSPSLRSEDDA